MCLQIVPNEGRMLVGHHSQCTCLNMVSKSRNRGTTDMVDGPHCVVPKLLRAQHQLQTTCKGQSLHSFPC
jgi:hypothetical protein